MWKNRTRFICQSITPVFDKDSLDVEIYIGNHLALVGDDNISLNNGKTWFEGTEGLWELLTNREPENFTEQDRPI